MKNSTNKAKYRRLAPIYDLFFGGILRNAREKALAELELKAGDRILLVGVGTGLDIPLLPEGCHITGIDISEAMLAKAQARVGARDVQLAVMNAEQLQFADGTFDCVVLTLLLSVTENPRGALSEAIRVLRAGGTILVFDKFVRKGKEKGFVRRLLNVFTSFVATDINRCFEDIVAGLPVRTVKDDPSLFGGNYRIILLEKQAS